MLLTKQKRRSTDVKKRFYVAELGLYGLITVRNCQEKCHPALPNVSSQGLLEHARFAMPEKSNVAEANRANLAPAHSKPASMLPSSPCGGSERYQYSQSLRALPPLHCSQLQRHPNPLRQHHMTRFLIQPSINASKTSGPALESMSRNLDLSSSTALRPTSASSTGFTSISTALATLACRRESVNGGCTTLCLTFGILTVH